MPFNLFGLGKKPKVLASTMIGVTDTGKRMPEKYSTSGKTFVILSSLVEKSPQTIADLAQETDIDIDELKKRVELLAKSGMVRIMAGE